MKPKPARRKTTMFYRVTDARFTDAGLGVTIDFNFRGITQGGDQVTANAGEAALVAALLAMQVPLYFSKNPRKAITTDPAFDGAGDDGPPDQQHDVVDFEVQWTFGATGRLLVELANGQVNYVDMQGATEAATWVLTIASGRASYDGHLIRS